MIFLRSRRSALRTMFQSALVGASAGTAALPALAQASVPAQKKEPSASAKFWSDGSPAYWPGNTILCHIPRRSDTFMALLDIHVKLMRSGLTHRIAPLPPASYHMTVFEGIAYPMRHRYFPSDLPREASEAACNAAFLARLAKFDPDLALPLRLRPLPLAQQTNSSSILLEPVDTAEDTRLRTLRDRLAEALNYRMPNHKSYRFHITLNYIYAKMDSAEFEQFSTLRQQFLAEFIQRSPLIELDQPEFTLFDDMFEFRTQLRLGRHA